ncbi:MAG: TDP-4-oxo-6-deoxy-D-glucose transaminase [Firmicutes bacterium]|nr:TDP-4-oxo-6-deoxy-D-glucose transaminase [Bacillota bacterium]
MIRFNKPYVTGNEMKNIQSVLKSGRMAGNGEFTQKCQEWLECEIGCGKALLTNSCTAALEMAIILADIGRGDEVIIPSYTFVSTANAVVLRGGIPVFVDIREDTLNIDETKIEAAITARTKAIIVVHYAGVACEMDTIMGIAEKYKLLVIEDAAQGILAKYKGRPLGSIGHLAALSFHETKNLVSGEGGALLINDAAFQKRAEIIWEKGTNRKEFYKGLVDKYSWVDIGSSYLPGELMAAFLYGQLISSEIIDRARMKVWNRYQESFAAAEKYNKFRRPIIPKEISHNGHIYYLLLPTASDRDQMLQRLQVKGIGVVFHYIPLHSSPAGIRYGRICGDMGVTDSVASRLIRLPLWGEMKEEEVELVISLVQDEANHIEENVLSE